MKNARITRQTARLDATEKATGTIVIVLHTMNQHIRRVNAYVQQQAERIKEMEVSVDVSTDDDDANNRYFGTITDLIRTPGSKNGFTLLVQDALPNF